MTRIVLAVLFCLGIVAWPATATAQESRLLRWDRYDVTIDLNANGTFRVCEIQEIAFVQGTFRTGFAAIPLDRVVTIQDVAVREGNTVYRQGDGTQPNTYRVSREDNNLRIDWAYPPTSNRSRTFEVCYTVVGGLRVHDWGDQLWWKAIPADRPYNVGSSTIWVRLPQPAPIDRLFPRTFSPSVTATIVDAQTVRYDAGSVPADEEVEIGLEFPHGLVNATAPPWQAQQEAIEEEQRRLEPYRALANLAFGGLAILVLIGGAIGAYALWFNRGRDVPVGKVAEYLREPPDDLPPAVVGTLIDEQVNLHDVLSTLPWLGSRGVIRITDASTEGFFGIGGRRDFLLERLASDVPLAPYEQAMLATIFGGQDRVHLSELKGKLLAQLPIIQQHLYAEVVQRGYFAANPETTRGQYRVLGFAVVAVAILLGIFVAPAIVGFAGAVYLPLIALGLVGLLLVALAQAMPRRTRAGALAAAKWQAFRRYLENIERYEQLDQAREIFERYLPFATAFGLERSWVSKFARADVPAPSWYLPSTVLHHPGYGYPRRGGYYGGYGGRGGDAGSSEAPVGDASQGGPWDIQDASDRGLGSLQDASDSLLDMFESASRVFRTPSGGSGGGSWGGGSWGGGGGGWSGGGGGGGGGGSRGFG